MSRREWSSEPKTGPGEVQRCEGVPGGGSLGVHVHARVRVRVHHFRPASPANLNCAERGAVRYGTSAFYANRAVSAGNNGEDVRAVFAR